VVIKLLFGRLLLVGAEPEMDMTAVAIADAGETP
jgi:hypothetical protein